MMMQTDEDEVAQLHIVKPSANPESHGIGVLAINLLVSRVLSQEPSVRTARLTKR